MKTTQVKRPKKSAKIGPPSKLTPQNRLKLQEAAALDASVAEMAYYCGVSHQTVYNWFEQDKELFDEITRLREKPILAARQKAVKGATESYQNAMDYLKRKRHKEFGDRTRQEHTGEGGGPIEIKGVKISVQNES